MKQISIRRSRGLSIRSRVLAIALIPSIVLMAVGVALAGYLIFDAVKARDFATRIRNAERPAIPFFIATQEERRLSLRQLAGHGTEHAALVEQRTKTDAAAAAVSYAAARLTQLTSFGDVATANKSMTPELATLRRSVEHDRYGLMAYVLSARDRCQPGQCAAYRLLTDHNQIAANMDERVYEGLILRYSASWNLPAVPAPASTAALPPSFPTGKPTNADFPSAASTPPVNIMTPEPPLAATPAAPRPGIAAYSDTGS